MLSPYPLKKHDEYSFEFVTDQGIKYVAYFIDYRTLFSAYPDIPNKIFSFNIVAIEGNPDERLSDDRIGLTILSVFRLFFQKSHNVTVYVCDSLDQRQLARKRKFDRWFRKYNDGSLVKEDDIAMVDGTEIYNSLILHRQNKYLKEIIVAFKELNETAGEKE